ncbi:hypothetical protein L211DRAFT_221015 [Terfezia boudieri ATCC MYA-4762]|uniref:Uncharacterized protein n=1 Tax=Terfezia boudieri ATCC MYA-4762 TaxID=1051890 RepID=A0A3N4LLU7_9PEZI|nr:hypothetical protein L211DRAFT_221015 [Terfezia boudieri ATCC MYA-4762]
MPRVTKITKIGMVWGQTSLNQDLVFIQYMSSTVAFVYMIFELFTIKFFINIRNLRTPINLRVLLFTKFYITIIVRYSSSSFTSFASFSGGSKTRFSFFGHYCCGW